MKKLTLQFPSLFDMCRFSKTLNSGYLLNTTNFTLTASLSDLQLSVALDLYNALEIETTEKVFSYDMV